MAKTAGRIVEIPRTSRLDLTVDDFEAEYLKKGLPVVIEDAITDWPAKNWTLSSLAEKVGDNDVYVRCNTISEDYKLGRKYDVREMKFRTYIENLISENEESKNAYLAVQNIKIVFPQLESDVILPPYMGKLHAGPYLWIARKGHYEYCHFDPDDGFLVMIQNSKKVCLYGGDYRPMYPNPLGSKGRTVQSQVNCDQPDLVKHPLFESVTCHQCVLKAGEMLYIPAFWWHQVTSLDVAISVNMFWGDAGNTEYITKLLQAPKLPTFQYWFLNIIEQNRSCGSFSRVLSRLPEAVYIFCFNQWKEMPSDEQVQFLVKMVMEYLSIESLPNERSSAKFPPRLKIRGLLWR